jgi:DNA repair protein RecO (recombination protein O)
MSRTYKATGINLKSKPLGESDRLLTILTREFGLVQAVAMGARKHNSKLAGRSGLFVVNDLLIARGRSLDKVAQADTLESYPGLGLDLKKLTASQYLAELCLCQALSDQPQDELFLLLNEHLQRLERSPAHLIMAHLTHAVFQMLVLAGIAPQVYACCMTRRAIAPNFSHSDWRTGFSIPAGGTVTLEVFERLKNQSQHSRQAAAPRRALTFQSQNALVTASELFLLQQLAQTQLPDLALPAAPPAAGKPAPEAPPEALWCAVERLLRQYSQFHFDRQIRSASLIEACFLSTPFPSPEV